MLDEFLIILIIPLLGACLLLLETWRGVEHGLTTRRRATFLLRLTGAAAALVATLLAYLGAEGVFVPGPDADWAIVRLLVYGAIAAAVGWVGWLAIRVSSPVADEYERGAETPASAGAENEATRSPADTRWRKARPLVALMLALPVLPIVVVVLGIVSVLSLDIWNLWPLGRQARAGQLLWTLALAERTHLDLAEEVEALAWSLSARHRRRLSRLADRLRDGTPLSSALAVDERLLSASHVAVIRVGEQTGRLAENLEELARQHSRALSYEVKNSAQAGIMVYLFGVTAILLAMITFLSIFVVPKMREIFADFGVELPTLTQRLLNATDMIVSCWYLLPLVILPFGALVVMAQLGRSAAGLANVPRVCRGLPRMRWPILFPVLAHVVRAERPLPELLRDVGGMSADQQAIAAFERLAVALERGDSLAEALVAERVVSTAEGHALATSDELGHAPWLIEGMLRGFETRWRERFLWTAELVQPITVLLLGVIVLIYCLSVMLPITSLLSQLQ